MWVLSLVTVIFAVGTALGRTSGADWRTASATAWSGFSGSLGYLTHTTFLSSTMRTIAWVALANQIVLRILFAGQPGGGPESGPVDGPGGEERI